MPRKPAPDGSVFVPRDVIMSPQVFGQTASLPGVREGVHPAQGRAAQLQHVVANAVREGRLGQGLTLKALVDGLDVPYSSYDRFARTLRGETMMSFADLCLWSDRFELVRMRVAQFVAAKPGSSD